MNIILAARLRELRAARKNTQEQLALHLGVTAQAVSKWEREEGFPDIAMLPAIAAFYNVSVDNLLGVDETARNRKLAEYEEESRRLSRQEDASKRTALWREACREFPNEPLVLHNLAFALRGEDFAANRDEIIALSQRLLKEATRSGEYFGAIHNLCRAYADIGDMEEAKRWASMAGRYHGTENQLMIHILDGEEAAGFCQWNIETLADLIAANAAVMLQKGTFSPEEGVQAGEQVLNLYALIYGGDYGFYHCRVSKWYLRVAKYRAQLGQTREALRCLELSLRHAAAFDALEPGRYTGPLVNRQAYSAGGSEPLLPVRQNELSDECFSLLKDEPGYQALLAGKIPAGNSAER